MMAEYIRPGDERDIPFDRFTRVRIVVPRPSETIDEIIEWMSAPEVPGQYTWRWADWDYTTRDAQFLVSDPNTAFALKMRWG